MSATRKPIWRRHWLCIGVVLLLALLGWYRFLREVPSEYSVGQYNDDALKYGTIGVETTVTGGFPLDIWHVLPDVFPEYLPSSGGEDGYAAFGFIQEAGNDLPVGLSRTYRGLDLVGLNCALCHAGSYRMDFDKPRVVVPGAPAITQDPQAYLRFLFQCGQDPRFDAATLIPAVRKRRPNLRLDEELVLRAFIPLVKAGLNQQANQLAWMDRNPSWGPGRIDPFNPIKFGILRRPLDQSIGNADMMPLWDLGNRARQGTRLHWDGLNGSIREVLDSSALGDGASTRTMDTERMDQLEEYLKQLKPPKYPGVIDKAAANRGKKIFEANCYVCHGDRGARTGMVISLAFDPADESDRRIATDPERVFMWDQAAADAYNRYGSGYRWQMYDFENHEGYVAVPLTGLWMRGPYLHNGSVPTLWHLLNPDERPATFYRGCDVLDLQRVGFVWSEDQIRQDGGRSFFLYDTRHQGNGNRGHHYGSELEPSEKKDLIEYLKQL